MIFDHVDYTCYSDYIREGVKNCDYFSTPLAEQQRKPFMEVGGGRPVHASLAYHWARLIELLYCTEAIRELLLDPDISGTELLNKGELRSCGIGLPLSTAANRNLLAAFKHVKKLLEPARPVDWMECTGE